MTAVAPVRATIPNPYLEGPFAPIDTEVLLRLVRRGAVEEGSFISGVRSALAQIDGVANVAIVRRVKTGVSPRSASVSIRTRRLAPSRGTKPSSAGRNRGGSPAPRSKL